MDSNGFQGSALLKMRAMAWVPGTLTTGPERVPVTTLHLGGVPVAGADNHHHQQLGFDFPHSYRSRLDQAELRRGAD